MAETIREIKDEAGKLIGLWLADIDTKPDDLDTWTMVTGHGFELFSLLTEERFRKIPNTMNDQGGVYWMFGANPVPSRESDCQAQPANQPQRQIKIVERAEAGFICPGCSTPIAWASGRISPDPHRGGWVQIEVSCPKCGVDLKTRIPKSTLRSRSKRWWQFWK